MRDDEKRPEVPDIGSRADDELSQYGDEQDMPVRRRRSAKATGKKDVYKRQTRNYAKRQLTWFRRDARVHWVPAQNRTAEEIAADIHKDILKDTEVQR